MSLQTLTAYVQNLEQQYIEDEDDPWENSEFAWIRSQAPATIGAIGRLLTRFVFDEREIPSTQSGYFLDVDGQQVRTKFSLQWPDGRFVFEQFRSAECQWFFCLGITPDSAYGWLIPAEEIYVDGVLQDRPGLKAQHTGAAGTETAWLAFDPNNPPEWLSEYGGILAQVEARISQTFGNN